MSESIYDLFRTDTDLELKGKWVGYGPSMFLIARAGGANVQFTKAYSAAMAPYQRQQRLGKFSEEDARDVMVGPFVDYCVLDWKKRVKNKETGEVTFVEHVIESRDGTDQTFSKDAAKKLLVEIPDLFSGLIEAASAISTFAPEDVEAAVKNL